MPKKKEKGKEVAAAPKRPPPKKRLRETVKADADARQFEYETQVHMGDHTTSIRPMSDVNKSRRMSGGRV